MTDFKLGQTILARTTHHSRHEPVSCFMGRVEDVTSTNNSAPIITIKRDPHTHLGCIPDRRRNEIMVTPEDVDAYLEAEKSVYFEYYDKYIKLTQEKLDNKELGFYIEHSPNRHLLEVKIMNRVKSVASLKDGSYECYRCSECGGYREARVYNGNYGNLVFSWEGVRQALYDFACKYLD